MSRSIGSATNVRLLATRAWFPVRALCLALAVATMLATLAGVLPDGSGALAAPADAPTGASAAAVTLPDLQASSLGNPPSALQAGASFTAKDTTANKSQQAAGASTTQFYLSLDKIKDGSDILLGGSRLVPALPAGKSSAGSAQVTVPLGAAPNTYFLLACADDLGVVPESNETNNCRASGGTVRQAAGPTLTPTATPSPSPTSAATPVPTTTATPTPTLAITHTPTATTIATLTATNTPTGEATMTATATPSPTWSTSATATPSPATPTPVSTPALV